MNSLRKWLYRPKRDDTSLMAQFYYADEELNLVAGELDSFDGRKDPERCTSLVNQLRQAQDKVLNICIEMMEELLPDERATRDFRAKFPDDVMQDTLAGQLWFGAECLAAGSSILNRESESLMMRPLAKAVTKTVENVRNLLREQCLKPIPEYTEKIRESLKIFDKLFAEFELNYVSAMVPVKSADEFEMQQNVVVLFSDTLQRAVKMDLISQDQIDYCDPALMFTVPRLAIVAGLVIFPDGPLRLEKDPKNLSELFRPFKNLLSKIRELLWTMSPQELSALEMCLCSMDEPSITMQSIENQSEDTSALYSGPVAFTSDFVHKFYTSYPTCRQLTPDMISMYACSKKNERSERKRDRTASKSSRTRARQERQSEKFLSRLTGIEERPRAKRRSKKDLQSHSRREHFPSDQDLIQSSTQLGYSSSRDRSRRSTRQSDYSQSSTNAPSEERQISSFQSPESDSPRPVSRSRRHRFSNRSFRISTVVCACGSLRQVRHPQTDSCLYSQSDVDPGHQDCVCSPEPESTSREEADALFESFANPFRRTVEEISGQNYRPPDECLWPAANIQNCVNNAVISDPYVLSPFSICESEEVSTTTSHVGTPSSNYVMSVNVSGNLADDFQNIVYVTHDDLSSSCNCCGDDGSSQGNAPRRCPNACQYFTLPSQASAPLITSPSNELLGEPSLSPRSDAPQSESSPTSPRNLSSPDQEILQITTTPEVFSSAVSSPVQPGEFFPSEGHSTTPNVDTNEYQLVDSSSCTPRDVLDHDPEGVPSSASPSPEHSNGEDDREIALAMQAAEVAASWKARERFTDSSDLIQRLFVCISGVADQLQTNCASDMRRILRCVFVMNQTPDEDELDMVKGKESKSNKDSPSEDGSSTNGSEEYSVESAEDAMAMIGTPECQGQGQLHSADDNSDLEEDSSLGFSGPNPDDTEVLSSAPETRLRVRSGSVVVPPSVFNEHSLMQYSTLSPPPMPTTSPIEQSRLVDEDLVAPESYRRNVFDDSSAFTSNQNEDGMIFSLDAPPDGPQFGAMELPSTITMTARAPAESSRSELDCDLSLLAPILASSSSSSPLATPTTGLPPDLLRASSIETLNHHRVSMVQEPPTWIPDHSAPRCMACGALFNVVRRRHHCRNCGKVFCGHCSRHSVPLPHFGIWKNVRVCNACFLYYVTSTADGSSALTS